MATATVRDMLTENQAAEMIGLQPGTLTNWRSRGVYGLPFVKVGRLVRYRRSDVEKWLASRTGTSVAELSEVE